MSYLHLIKIGYSGKVFSCNNICFNKYLKNIIMVVLYHFREIFNESLQQKSISLPTTKQPFLNINFENTDTSQTVYHGQKPLLPFAESEIFDANICHWRCLTAESCDCKAVYEVTVDITGSNFNFRPGDTIGVIPQNLDEEVDVIVDHLNLSSFIDVDYNISINTSQKGAKIPPHLPVKSTLRHVLKHCIDLRGVIKKLFLLALSKYTEDETERRTLEYLCSKEGATAYTTHVLKGNLCLLDLFIIFKTCKPPVEVILEHLPRLLPRPYSIVSSALTNPNKLKFCFSVMDIGNGRKGLVTGWLEKIINNCSLENLLNNLSIKDNKQSALNNIISIYMRKNINQFSFPESCDNAMLLIGPGTGVAPYIGFLEEREYSDIKKEKLIWLFFGCRNPELDFIYEDELKSFLATGVLDKLTTAFSRVENCENKYIQETLLHNGKEVTKLIKEGAQVYVCGDVRILSAQVKEVLLKCLVEFGGDSLEEAEKFISDMQKDKKYLIDSWN